MNFVATKVRTSVRTPKKAEGVHICPDGWGSDTDPFEKVEALCGARAYLYLNGEVVPDGFDFYTLGLGHEAATCSDCRKAAGLQGPEP